MPQHKTLRVSDHSQRFCACRATALELMPATPRPTATPIIQTYQRLSELIRLIPIDSDWFRLVPIASDAKVAPRATGNHHKPLSAQESPRAGLYNMSKNAVPPGGAVTARGDNRLSELACSVRLPPIPLRNDAKVQRSIPRRCIKVYRSVLNCIVTYPNVSNCIETYPNVLNCIEVY